jgi:hypothetical protein
MVYDKHPHAHVPWLAVIVASVLLLGGVQIGSATRAQAAATSTYYVSSSAGNDGSTGTSASAPWQSLAKVNATVLKPGDQVLFRAGDSWTGQLAPGGSGTNGATITFGSYGTGGRPVINGAGALPATIALTAGQQYLDITGLEITNTSSVSAIRSGILVDNPNTTPLTHIHLTDLSIHGVSGQSYVGQSAWQDPGDGGIVITGRSDSVTSRVDDVLIDTVTMDTVDDCGVRIQPRNTSARATGVVVRNVTVNNAGGNGIQVSNTTNGLVEHNKVTNGGSRSTASAGIWSYYTDNNVLQYNEVSGETTTWNDGFAFDFDYRNNNIVFQYNYSHDNPTGFTQFFRQTNGTVRYNISQNDGTAFRLYDYPGAWTSDWLKIYNNTIWTGPGATKAVAESTNPTATYNATFKNNVFINNGTGAYTALGAQWDHNLFFGNHPSSEPPDAHKVTGDPLLAWGGSATSRAGAAGYQLRTGSPALGAGAPISDNGGRDFWGNAVSPTGNPAIGAFNGTPTSVGIQMTSVDDSVQGSGPNQMAYSGSWGHCSPCGGDSAWIPLHGGSNSWSKIANDTAILAFNGTRASVYGLLGPDAGIAALSVDGGPETLVDQYNVSRQGNTILWSTPLLPAGTHSMKIRVTGTKNISSTGAYVEVDRVDVGVGNTSVGAVGSGISGQCLDVRGASTANGTAAQLWGCNDATAQVWSYDNGAVVNNGKCLDAAGGGTANGTLIDLWECNSTEAQKWLPQADGSLKNPKSGRCLDDPALGGAGTQLVIWDCNGGANQKWSLP